MVNGLGLRRPLLSIWLLPGVADRVLSMPVVGVAVDCFKATLVFHLTLLTM
jgi:hypothetical protein